MSSERDKPKDTSRYHITHKITAEINLARKLSTDRIFGHCNMSQHMRDILLDLYRGSLGKLEVAKDFPHVVLVYSRPQWLYSHQFLCFPGKDICLVTHTSAPYFRREAVHMHLFVFGAVARTIQGSRGRPSKQACLCRRCLRHSSHIESRRFNLELRPTGKRKPAPTPPLGNVDIIDRFPKCQIQ